MTGRFWASVDCGGHDLPLDIEWETDSDGELNEWDAIIEVDEERFSYFERLSTDEVERIRSLVNADVAMAKKEKRRCRA